MMQLHRLPKTLVVFIGRPGFSPFFFTRPIEKTLFLFLRSTKAGSSTLDRSVNTQKRRSRWTRRLNRLRLRLRKRGFVLGFDSMMMVATLARRIHDHQPSRSLDFEKKNNHNKEGKKLLLWYDTIPYLLLPWEKRKKEMKRMSLHHCPSSSVCLFA